MSIYPVANLNRTTPVGGVVSSGNARGQDGARGEESGVVWKALMCLHLRLHVSEICLIVLEVGPQSIFSHEYLM